MQEHLQTFYGTQIPLIFSKSDLERYFPLVPMVADTQNSGKHTLFFMRWNFTPIEKQTRLPTDVLHSEFSRKLDAALQRIRRFKIYSKVGSRFIGFIDEYANMGPTLSANAEPFIPFSQLEQEAEENIPTLAMNAVLSNIHRNSRRKTRRTRKQRRIRNRKQSRK